MNKQEYKICIHDDKKGKDYSVSAALKDDDKWTPTDNIFSIVGYGKNQKEAVAVLQKNLKAWIADCQQLLYNLHAIDYDGDVTIIDCMGNPT